MAQQNGQLTCSDNPTTSSFPSAYTFDTTEQDEAKARRAARFQKEAEVFKNGGNEQSGPHYTPDADADLGSRIAGIGPLPSQVGRKKLKGKGGAGFGYTEPEPEVDPVSLQVARYS